jgi:hypothetical protein
MYFALIRTPKIKGGGSGVTRNPYNGLLTLRDDSRRKGARLLPRPGYK